MEPPEDAVETGHAAYWVHDGILVERTKNLHFTREMVEEDFRVLRDLGGVSVMPFLFDIREWKGAVPDGWLVAVDHIPDLFSAVALLVDPGESISPKPAWPKAFAPLMVPVKISTSEDEAMRFLRGFVLPNS